MLVRCSLMRPRPVPRVESPTWSVLHAGACNSGSATWAASARHAHGAAASMNSSARTSRLSPSSSIFVADDPDLSSTTARTGRSAPSRGCPPHAQLADGAPRLPTGPAGRSGGASKHRDRRNCHMHGHAYACVKLRRRPGRPSEDH